MAKQVYSSEYINNAMETRYYYSDRDVNDEPALPYTFHDIKIKPNDLVTTNAINGSLGKLYDNLLYIISQSRVPQAIIPRRKEFTTVIATTQGGDTGMMSITGHPSSNIASLKSSTQTTQVTAAQTLFVSEFKNQLDKTCCMLFTDTGESTGMTIFYDHAVSGVDVRSFTTDLDNFTNRKLSWASKMVHYEYLGFILAPFDKAIYKYDMTGLLTDDKAYFDPDTRTHGKLLMDFVGGFGTVEDDMRFASPVTMDVDEDGNLYVIDDITNNRYPDQDDGLPPVGDEPDSTSSATETSLVTKRVKVFDKNVNFKFATDLTDVVDDAIVDMAYKNGRFYLLTFSSIVEMSKRFVKLNEWSLDSYQLDPIGEHYQQIVLSREDDNVAYISTNRNIIKKFLSKPDKIIAPFVFINRGFGIKDSESDPELQISSIAVAESEQGEYVYVCDNRAGMIYKFDEAMDYQHCIDNSFERSFIKLHDVEIKPDEFVSHIVYNKSLSKLLYNHFLVGNNITGKLLSEWVDPYIRRYKATRYALPDEIFSRALVPRLNNFIGVNEPLTSSVVNRTLNEIWQVQMKILTDTKLQVTNSRPAETVPEAADAVDNKWSVGDDGEWKQND